MSVHQRDDGRWIVVFKGTDGKRKERSFGRGPDAEAAAYAFDAAMKSRALVRGGPLVRTGNSGSLACLFPH